jgi:peptide/nickel transport system permease protein
VFSSLYLAPGDPVTAIVGSVPISVETRERLRVEYGFDRPLPVQYASFVARAVRGDLGYSYRFHSPVSDLILAELPATVELMVASMLVGLVLGSFLGAVAALSPRTWIDTGATLVATVGLSIPSFWFGMILLLVFAVDFRLVPSFGSDSWSTLILPTVTLAVIVAAVITRLMRSSLLEVLSQDYIATARSKGASELRVLLRHALQNAAIPLLSVVGLQIGNLLAGAVVVETIFSRHGIGHLLVEGIQNRDFPIVQGTVLFITASYVCVNLIIDLLYTVIDPRIRHQARQT